MVQGNRVDILVEEQSEVDHEEHDGEALGTDVVWEDLDAVADEHARPSHVVEEVIDVDHSVIHPCQRTRSCVSFGLVLGGCLPNDCIGRSSGTIDRESCRAYRPDTECHQHTGGRDDEELAPANLVHEEAEQDGGEEVENL